MRNTGLFQAQIGLCDKDFRSKHDGHYIDIWDEIKRLLDVDDYFRLKKVVVNMQLVSFILDDGRKIVIGEPKIKGGGE